MREPDRSRIAAALEDLTDYRDDGEDVIDNLSEVAEFYSVPIDKLRAHAELKWGAPLETDRERNASHFAAAAERCEKRAQDHALRNDLIKKAKESALHTWKNCSPDGEPDWQHCSKRFIIKNGISETSLRTEIEKLFLKIGADFQESVSLYNKWTR